jgi:hypothetical protein
MEPTSHRYLVDFDSDNKAPLGHVANYSHDAAAGCVCQPKSGFLKISSKGGCLGLVQGFSARVRALRSRWKSGLQRRMRARTRLCGIDAAMDFVCRSKPSFLKISRKGGCFGLVQDRPEVPFVIREASAFHFLGVAVGSS